MRARDPGWARGRAGRPVRPFRRLPATLLSGFLFASLAIAPAPSSAGQVVTKETREWAASALREEKAVRPAAARNTVAVLYFGNRTGDPGNDPLRKGLPLLLTTDLSSVQGLQVIERIRLQALQEEMALGVSGLVEPGTEPRVGRLLGAQWIVGGDVSGAPAPLRVESRVLEVPKAEVVGQPAATGDIAELFKIEKELLFGIISVLKIEVSPAEETRLRKPCSTRTEALFALFRAVDASDRGDYEKSAELYGQALKEDPNVCLAADGLKELRELGLIRPPAKRTLETLRTLKGETSVTDQLGPKDVTRGVLPPASLPTPTNVDVIFP